MPCSLTPASFEAKKKNKNHHCTAQKKTDTLCRYNCVDILSKQQMIDEKKTISNYWQENSRLCRISIRNVLMYNIILG